MNIKKAFLFVHRWLGFISGLVVFIVSITGCLFCFQDEIQDALYNWRHVEMQHRPYVLPSALKQTALRAYPKATAGYIYYYGSNRPAVVLAGLPGGKLQYVYINPYTNKILHTEDPATNFFTIVEFIHLYLLLPARIGQLVVGISVIMFVILLITGMVLWWPRRKADRKRSFTIKWNGRWRRVNYDLHNVLGFYACAVALVLAVTGLAIAFDWARSGMYLAANGGKSFPQEKAYPKSDSLNKTVIAAQPVIDKALIVAQQQSPDAAMFLIGDNAGPAGTVSVTAYHQSLHYGHSDYYYFDKYTGRLLQTLPYAKKSAGLKLNDMNYDIHVGQILGLPGKIIAFMVSLIAASLPVTGLLIWLGKRKKPKSAKVKHVVARRAQGPPAGSVKRRVIISEKKN